MGTLITPGIWPLQTSRAVNSRLRAKAKARSTKRASSQGGHHRIKVTKNRAISSTNSHNTRIKWLFSNSNKHSLQGETSKGIAMLEDSSTKKDLIRATIKWLRHGDWATIANLILNSIASDPLQIHKGVVMR